MLTNVFNSACEGALTLHDTYAIQFPSLCDESEQQFGGKGNYFTEIANKFSNRAIAFGNGANEYSNDEKGTC